ncbi:putative peptidase M20 family protein [Sphingomonas sp. MM-1]|uniref:M20/M25/M40 family metallo-hydrolase n=1 Tax=Sphingomonas sp. MM-1 TaxID=745310 RepID=UPI0002C0CFC0|nr:M20/M25/M40 family metallo-hydrolase [Sphingomonas sp. MM-1]AGH48482.1 putative peptidase M20 family protein [Sphingomonas sp. MM-1]
MAKDFQADHLGRMNLADRRAVLRGAAAGAALFAPGAALAESGDLAAIRKAVAAGHDHAVQLLQDWIRLPSIAAENRDMEKGCAHMMALARDAGFQHVERVPTSGHPGVFATLDAGAKKWMGIYFMYDVKQYDPAEWSVPPVEARLIDKAGFGKVIMGRGAVNQKGPEATFLAALHALRAAGRKLPVNLVLVAEGEEEIGSPHFSEIVHRPDVLAAMKKCVGVIIPTGWQSPSTGGVAVNLGAKGVIEFELIASGEKWGRGPARDIHSSEKARVDSPAWRLVAALSTLVTPDGNMPVVDGYMDNVRPLTAREKALIAEAGRTMSEADAKRALGVERWIGDLPWQQALERLAAVPTINIEGLVSGYTGPGGKTVLPGRAVAKIDCRIVPNQTKDEAVAKIRAHLDKHGFQDVEMAVSGGYDPTETAEDSKLVKAELAVYARNKVPTTVYPRLAGSWPGVVFTGQPVGLPAGQFGLGHGSGAHAPDEYFVIESTNPKIAGMDDAAMGFVDFLYEIAAVG